MGLEFQTDVNMSGLVHPLHSQSADRIENNQEGFGGCDLGRIIWCMGSYRLCCDVNHARQTIFL